MRTSFKRIGFAYAGSDHVLYQDTITIFDVTLIAVRLMVWLWKIWRLCYSPKCRIFALLCLYSLNFARNQAGWLGVLES